MFKNMHDGDDDDDDDSSNLKTLHRRDLIDNH